MVQLSHPYMTTGKTISWTTWTFVSKVMSLLFNMLSRLVIASLPRSKCLLISWLQSPSAVIWEPKKEKSITASTFSLYLPWSDGTSAKILVFWMLSFKPAFSLSSFTLIKRLFICSSLFAIRVVSSAHLRLLIFLPAILIPAWDTSSLAFQKWQPTPVFLPGKSHGQRSLVGYSPRGHKKLNTIKHLTLTLTLHIS